MSLVRWQAQRLVFDQNSPNGILLFRECSKIAVAFGTRLLQARSFFIFQKLFQKKKSFSGVAPFFGFLPRILCYNIHLCARINLSLFARETVSLNGQPLYRNDLRGVPSLSYSAPLFHHFTFIYDIVYRHIWPLRA